jgi:plastocyanin
MKSLLLVCFFFEFTAAAAQFTVVQKDLKFSPATIQIKKGDTILFKNTEKDMSHNIFSAGPKNIFPNKIIPAGQDFAVQFNEPGKTEVQCSFHVGMKMNIDVTN